MGLGECLEETPPKQPREDAYRQEETGPAGDPALPVGRQATARDDRLQDSPSSDQGAPTAVTVSSSDSLPAIDLENSLNVSFLISHPAGVDPKETCPSTVVGLSDRIKSNSA